MKSLISPLVAISGRIKNLSIIAHGMSSSKRARSGEKRSPVSGAVPWALPAGGIQSGEYRLPRVAQRLSARIDKPGAIWTGVNPRAKWRKPLWVSRRFYLNLALSHRTASILVNPPRAHKPPWGGAKLRYNLCV